jgi:hypothetical protein
LGGAQQPDDAFVDQLTSFDARDGAIPAGDGADGGQEGANELPARDCVAGFGGDDQVTCLLEGEP